MMSLSDVRARGWRAYADGRRVLGRHGSAAASEAATEGARRSDESSWTATLATRHGAYRESVEPAPGSVAIVGVSARPQLLDAVVADVSAQTHPVDDLVIVTNASGYDDIDIEAAAAPVAARGIRLTVLRRSPQRSLGACLNDGFEATDARFVAKFDDDDHYGPHYIADALRAHSYAGAGVVGKHTYYAHLGEHGSDEGHTVLRFPTHEYTYSSTLAGGTLVVDRERTGDLRFPDISLGEDRAFLASCHRQGVSTFSADRFNFLQTRAGDNTWAVSTDRFLVGTVPVAGGRPLEIIDR